MEIEIVFALPDKQELRRLRTDRSPTIAEALTLSGLRDAFPGHDFDNAAVAIWGQVVPPTTNLSDGDRVEVLRPLAIDPREARRRLAEEGGAMGTGRKKS